MIATGQDLLAAVVRVRTALEETAGALAAADLDRLLRSEAALEFALRAVPNPPELPPDIRAALLDEALRARLALNRCRRLGGVLEDVVRATFTAQGRGTGYGPRELPPGHDAPRTLDARG